MSNVMALGYAPFNFVGFITVAVWFVDAGQPLWWLIPLLFTAITLSFLIEQRWPYEERWNEPINDRWRDVAHAIVNESASVISIATIPVLAIWFGSEERWPGNWPLWLQLAFAMLVADVGITLAHYASHRWSPLWRLHAVHHSVRRLYGFNGLMKHPLHQTIETVAGTTPLLLLGIPIEVGALLAFAVAIQLLLQHANIRMNLGWLNYVWAVAPGHRHHHIASESKGDVNFGLFTLLWDHMLGTFVIDRPQPGHGEVGLVNHPKYPEQYLGQLIEPFRSSAATRRSVE